MGTTVADHDRARQPRRRAQRKRSANEHDSREAGRPAGQSWKRPGSRVVPRPSPNAPRRVFRRRVSASTCSSTPAPSSSSVRWSRLRARPNRATATASSPVTDSSAAGPSPFSHDQTVYGGSVGEMFGRKVCYLMEWAGKLGCPIVGINDSGGARIQDAVVSLAWYGEMAQHGELLSGLTPQVSVILGKCAGGAVYCPQTPTSSSASRTTATCSSPGPTSSNRSPARTSRRRSRQCPQPGALGQPAPRRTRREVRLRMGP